MEKGVGNFCGLHLPMLLVGKNVHLSILLLRLPMLLNLSKITLFGEHKMGG